MPDIRKVFSKFKGRSFSDVFPDIQSIRETDIFLNCDSYQVLLPMQAEADSELNLFERTILRLLTIRPMMTDELAELLCLKGGEGDDKSDFVSFVLSSLKERDYIDDYNRPTGKFQMHLPDDPFSGIGLEKTAVRVFALRGTDHLISLVCRDENDIVLADYTNGYITAEVGTVGTQRKVNGRAYNFGKTSSARPSGKSARKILGSSKEPTLTTAGPVYVHLKAVVQHGCVDEVLISDGEWPSNDALAAFIDSWDPGYKYKRIEDARSNSMPKAKNSVNDRVGGKYPEVRKLLDKIPKEPISDPVGKQTEDDRRRANENNLEVVQYLYAAFEWALAYSLRDNAPDKQLLDEFFSQGRRENRALSLKGAYKAGFCFGTDKEKENTGELLGMCDGKDLYKDFEKGLGSPDFTPVFDRLLPLCLAAAGCEPLSPWYKIAAEQKNLFNFLYNLRYIAKKVRHSDRDGKVSVNLLNYLKENTFKTIKLLLPYYEGEERAVDMENGDASEEKINELASLLPHKLTYMEYDSLPEGAKQELLKIAPVWDENNMLDAYDFVLALSKTAEIVLRKSVSDVLSRKADLELNKDDALKKIKDRIGVSAPAGLRYVSKNYYEKAAGGGGASLGAYALVWAAYLDDEKFKSAGIDEVAEILNFISEIAGLRGHGNNVGLYVSEKKLTEGLREKLFKLIKLIKRLED